MACLKLQPLLSLGIGCLVGARRKSGQQVACLTGIPAVHPCWHLTNDEMSRKKKLRCAIYATSQQRLRQGL